MEQKKLCLSINARNMDRISSLPDCILHQILSFLETKNAVQTSTLSKRWQNVFDTTSYFNFSYNFCEFADPLQLPAAAFNELFDGHKDGFQKCIFKVLHAQNGYDCKKIIIRCDLKLDSSFMSEVMEYAVKHKAQELEIMTFSDNQDSLKFPMSIYTCKTLEKLKLGGDQYDCIYVSKSMGFQFLKELRFYRLFFDTYYGFSEDIFSHCPCLELLSLVACCLDSSLESWVPSLKTFELIFPLSEKLSSRPSFIRIYAPLLSYIKYEGPDPMDFVLPDSASSLEEIDIDIQDDLSDKEDFRKKFFTERLIDMLRSFHNAKSVIISLNTLKILSSMPSLLRGQESPFANLKNIQLKTSWSKLAPGWSFLLKNSPNVRALIQGDLNRVTRF
ncbi:F-box/FBD/LRR-repeat protein At1g78750-like [Silene latifolia]|uniref:F-box/FBD/LRR-repeat protein At1g78750-like n=1 Tax=Silene latifolia TaxID=37657 RepID=UPI003D7880C5